jgi:Secreted and surface protein containing fasciclin-like repeats
MNKDYIIIGVVVGALILGGIILTRSNSPMTIGETEMTKTEEMKMEKEEVVIDEEMDEEMEEAMAEDTVVDIAVADGRFKTLVTALKAADLVETLSGDGPFTVFAPTDDAFAKLPEGTVEGLLEDTEKLTDILTYHVVSGKVMAADAANLTSAEALNGKELTIDATDGVMINDAEVIIADIEAANGVIHVIDTVLLPE